jgi:hypothetical protein
MPFGYVRDPLFIACVAIYLVNRFVLKQIWSSGFVHEHLNDLICVPFWVPIMLSVQRWLRLRPTDGIPTAGELIIPLVMWSWVFEIVLPATDIFGDWCVADYLDIVCYAVGTLAAAIFWRVWYPPRDDRSAAKKLARGSGETASGADAGLEGDG